MGQNIEGEERTAQTVWSICFDFDRSWLELELGRSAGASIATRVYHNAKLRMSILEGRQDRHTKRRSLEGNAERKSNETTTRSLLLSAKCVRDTQ